MGDICYRDSLPSCTSYPKGHMEDSHRRLEWLPQPPTEPVWSPRPLLSCRLAAAGTHEHLKDSSYWEMTTITTLMPSINLGAWGMLHQWHHTLWLWPGTALVESHQLAHMLRSGIVLNLDKFQFAGFRVSDSSIEPLLKYLQASESFPQRERGWWITLAVAKGLE